MLEAYSFLTALQLLLGNDVKDAFVCPQVPVVVNCRDFLKSAKADHVQIQM